MSQEIASSLYSALKAHQPISIAGLAALLHTTPETVRLALADLAADGIRVQADKTGAYSIVSKGAALFTPAPDNQPAAHSDQAAGSPNSAAAPTEQALPKEISPALTAEPEQRAQASAAAHEAHIAASGTSGTATQGATSTIAGEQASAAAGSTASESADSAACTATNAELAALGASPAPASEPAKADAGGLYTEQGDFLTPQERGLTPPLGGHDAHTATAATQEDKASAESPAQPASPEGAPDNTIASSTAESADKASTENPQPEPTAQAGAENPEQPEAATSAEGGTAPTAATPSPALPTEGSPDLGQLIKQVEDAKNAALAPEKRTMGMMDHLNELRWRLMRCVIAVGIAFMLCWSFAEPLFGEIMRPLNAALPDHSKLIYTAPAEAFFTYMRVAFVASIFAASPFIFYQIWSFIAPGLYDEEKRYAIPMALVSAFFFIGGGCFCYFGVLPIAFQFFMGFATDTIMPMPSLTESLDFVLKLMVAFGAIFEMPLFTFFLARMGLVTAKMMSSTRRYAVLVIFIVAAILTPPDVMSQLLMAIPMLVLYELSILIARVFGRAKKAEQAEEGKSPNEKKADNQTDQTKSGTAA
ncbi:MAG: twin-arginine translocase subunit TatC [Desulfovibrionaceae bacterium]|nr:twin-arginine translocase subunit TatC [Desulfovibrionaceae bacterium]